MPRPITKMALQSSNVVISLDEGQESLPDSLLATPGGPQLLQTISDEAARADSMDGGESVIDVESTTDSMMPHFFQSSFSGALLALPRAHKPTTAQLRLNNLFEDEMKTYEKLNENNWKYPDYPLARIKKIMRMDEDVQMISGEVPILFSKAIELFVTELTLRSWIYTEETKRRTIQRSDIAMAISKNDMFDFLIDIVPREDINPRSKTHKVNEEMFTTERGTINQDLLQAYMQLLQQAEAENREDVVEGEGVVEGEAAGDVNVANLTVTSNMMQQQLQLLQQLAQAQQQQPLTQEDVNPPQSVPSAPPTSAPPTPTPLSCVLPPPLVSAQEHQVLDVLSAPPYSLSSTASSVPQLISIATPSASSSSTELLVQPETLHYQTHDHSSTDITTLLTSGPIDSLPVSTQFLNMTPPATTPLPPLPTTISQEQSVSRNDGVHGVYREQTLHQVVSQYSSSDNTQF